MDAPSPAPGNRRSTHWCGTAAGWCRARPRRGSPGCARRSGPTTRIAHADSTRPWTGRMCRRCTGWPACRPAPGRPVRRLRAARRAPPAGAGSASPPAAHRRPAARSRAGPGRRHPPSPARRRRPHPPPAARRRCSPGCDAAACPRRGIDRHRHRAQPAAAQHHRQELDPVARHQRHAVAPAHAMGGQQRGPRAPAPRHIPVFRPAPGPRRARPGARPGPSASPAMSAHACSCFPLLASVRDCLPTVENSLGINYLYVKFMVIIFLINQTDMRGNAWTLT